MATTFQQIGRAIARSLAPTTGSERIDRAIGHFEEIATELEAAVKENEAVIAANLVQISELEAENVTLDLANGRGKSVAAKLRELIA